MLQLKSQKFREAREGDWKALARQLDRVDRDGVKALSAEDLLGLPLLYRSGVSSLSMAQSISLDRNLITYLQGLTARAYIFIYGPQTRLGTVLKDFFVDGWPVMVRRLWRELAFAFVTLVVGFIAGWLVCAHDANWYDILVGGQAQGRDLFKRLIAKASVLCENYSPGQMERWELGYDTLREINPGLIYLQITGMGKSGTYNNYLSVGPTAQAHITAPDLKQSLVLFRHKDSLGVRYKGEVMVNGNVSTGRAFLPPVATVQASDISFAIEPTK